MSKMAGVVAPFDPSFIPPGAIRHYDIKLAEIVR
jgi:hypothetical protein